MDELIRARWLIGEMLLMLEEYQMVPTVLIAHADKFLQDTKDPYGEHNCSMPG